MLKTPALTGVTLIAFAANSLFNRLALGEDSIDAASFMTLRLISGAVMLLVLTVFSQGKLSWRVRGQWFTALMLFLYAVTFSFAYQQLSAGTGALILFGTVQVTMIVAALRQGEKPGQAEWAGLLLALGGLVYLVLPGLAAPPLVGTGLMMIAGVAWGIYSLRGRGVADPVANTTRNFVLALPFAVGVSVVNMGQIHLSLRGVIWAVLAGAITSGLGYALWYAALKGLTATQAAMVQLAVPVLAAIGGILFLQEALSMRLVVASLVILGGIGWAVLGRRPKG